MLSGVLLNNERIWMIWQKNLPPLTKKHCPATGNECKKEFILLIGRSEKIIF
jgi:hypothetical protein